MFAQEISMTKWERQRQSRREHPIIWSIMGILIFGFLLIGMLAAWIGNAFGDSGTGEIIFFIIFTAYIAINFIGNVTSLWQETKKWSKKRQESISKEASRNNNNHLQATKHYATAQTIGTPVAVPLPQRMTCVDCGAELPEDAQFCINCGRKVEPLVVKQFCRFCGNRVEDKSRFCPHCGRPL